MASSLFAERRSEGRNTGYPKGSAWSKRGCERPEGILSDYVEGFERLRMKLGAFSSSLLVVHFNLEARGPRSCSRLRGRLARCREVAVHEDGVGWIERRRLKAAEIVFAAAGNADFGTWVEETEEAEALSSSVAESVDRSFLAAYLPPDGACSVESSPASRRSRP